MIRDSYAQGLPIWEQLLERTRRSPESHFSLLALFEDSYHAADAGNIATNLSLVQQGWNSGIYILRIHALEFLQSMSREVEEKCPQELPRIREILEGFETDNIVENTVRLETLALFGGLEPPASLDHALLEMRSVIAPNAADDPGAVQLAALSGVSPTQFLAEQAYGYLARIFEDIFQGVYSEAYAELSEEEKRDILCLAGNTNVGGFTSNWILQELLRCGGARALPIYQQCASGVDAENLFVQGAVADFVLGIEGCAQWSEAPPPYHKGDSPEHKAWQTIGEILFWARRGTAVDNHKRIEELWARFEGLVLLAAGDVLYQLNNSRWILWNNCVLVTITSMFPKEVRSIVEQCITDRESLPSVFRHGGSANRDVIRFLIHTLEKIGDATSISTLQPLVDDREFGKDAVQAIKSIQKTTLRQRALRAPQ